MRITRLRLRNIRSYAEAELTLGPGLTVVSGRNGAGKTNLLEALYLACTGRSCRTAIDRHVVRHGEAVGRVELDLDAADGAHRLGVGIQAGEGKRMAADGATVERLLEVACRPLVSVFLPDRLELVKGAPALRRAHLDQVVAALWPARVATRRAYGRALAQRNALLARGPAVVRASLATWDAELARHGMQLIADRSRAVGELAEHFTGVADALGLDGAPGLAYRPRSRAADAAELAAELAQRHDRDIERGFTGHGPHRDELVLTREERELRTYGSQGQQRLALLALLLAERAAIATARSSAPLLLLDDVMSELDHERRSRLVALLRAGGQSVVTTTELAHVPESEADDVTRVAVAGGAVLQASGESGRVAA